MAMTENNIKKLGFNKCVVTAEESGFDKDFYYYERSIGDLCLLSNDNANRVDGKWYVEIPEGSIRFFKYVELKNLIGLLERNKY